MAPEKPNKQPESPSPDNNRADKKAESPEQKSEERVQKIEKDLKKVEEKIHITKERQAIYDSDPSSKEFDEWASSKEGQTYHVYSIVSEDTRNALDQKIKILERNLESDRQEKARARETRLAKRNWFQRMMRVGEERIDIDPMTGEPRLTDMQKIEKAQREVQEETLKNLQFKRLDLRKGFDGKDYGEKLENLKKFRISIGLPALPHGLVDYDTFQKMAIQGIEEQDPSTKVNWDAVKGRIDSFVSLLDKLETTLQVVDTGVGIAASFVPYGDEVYEITKQLTYVSTGEKTAEQAAKDFAFNIIASKVAGKAVDKLQIGKLAEKYAKAFAKKFSKEFAQKAIPFLTKVGASSAEGAARGTVSGAVESGLHGIDKGKSADQILNDAIAAAERGAMTGAILGPVGVYLRYKLANRNKTQSNEQPAQLSKEDILSIPDTADGRAIRVALAQELLDLPSINELQVQAVLDAHDVTMSGDKYSVIELAQKMRILEAGGFTREQADALLRMGVCGSKPTFGPPPPPPPRKKPSTETTQPAPAATPAGTPATTNVIPKGPRPPPPPPRRNQAPQAAPLQPSPFEMKLKDTTIKADTPLGQLGLSSQDIDAMKTWKATPMVEKRTALVNGDFSYNIPAGARVTYINSPDNNIVVARIEISGRPTQHVLLRNSFVYMAKEAATPASTSQAAPAQPKPNPVQPPQASSAPKPIPAVSPSSTPAPTQKSKPPEAEPSQKKNTIPSSVHSGPQAPEVRSKNFVKQYGNLDESKLKLRPDAENILKEYKQKGRFTVAHYLEGAAQQDMFEWMDMRQGKGNKMQYKILNMDAAADEGKLNGSKEMLAISKIRNRSGLVSHADVIEGGSNETAVQLTYIASGVEYQTNTINNTVRAPSLVAGSVGGKISNLSGVETDPNHDVHQDIFNLKTHAPSTGGRPYNQVAVSIVLPESQAKVLTEYFKSNPTAMRSFFLQGGEDLFLPHVPPPYEKWDQTKRPIVIREYELDRRSAFKDTKIKND